jgi:hypothetical protein
MRPERWLFTIPLRLRSLFRWVQADQELDDELRDHLERKTEKYVTQGMTQEEAHRRARLDLDGIEQTKEKCRDARRVTRKLDSGPNSGLTLRAAAFANGPDVHERNSPDTGTRHRCDHFHFYSGSRCSVAVVTSGEAWRTVPFGERIPVLLPGRV